MNNGIIYKSIPTPKIPAVLKQGWVIVTKSRVGFIVNNTGILMIHSLNNGQYWGSDGDVRAYESNIESNLNRLMSSTTDGFKPGDIVAIYDSIKSWIADGAPGL